MAESGSPLTYYCTAGKGMEHFLAEEVQLKLSASDVNHVPGKVFFTTGADIQQVCGLKSAERLFLLLKKEPPLPDTRGAGQVARLIREKIIGEPQAWTSALRLWQSLRCGLRKEEAIQSTTRRGLKRKWLPEEAGCSQDRALPVGESHVDGRDAQAMESGVSEGESLLAESLTPKGGEVPSTQEPPVTFRVSCRCSGVVARSFSSQDLGRLIGTAISKQLRWRVELREPELEVNIHLTDDLSVIGMPLLRVPLAQRSYIKTTGLRSTVAWVMVTTADIKPGSVVLDPMCGVGTVLLEAAREYQSSFFLGMDIDPAQLRKASENIEFAELTNTTELMQSSVAAIPLPSCSVDAVVCDVPFGRKFGSKADAVACLPAAVKEMERVLRSGGTLVLLLSPQLSIFLGRMLNPTPTAYGHGRKPGGEAVEPGSPAILLPSLQLSATYRVGLGTTDGLIHTYRKVPIQGEKT